MKSKYKVYEKQDVRTFRPGVSFAIGLVVLFTTGLGLVVYDLLANPDVIDESGNQTVLGEFKSTIDRFKTVTTDDYTVEVPEDWVNVNRPEIIVNGQRYYPERYQGVTGSDIGRSLDIYVEEIPDLALEYVVPVSQDGLSTISQSPVSPNCSTFTELIDERREPVATTWEGAEFTCSMSQSRNTIATVKSTTTSGISVVGEKSGPQAYLFVYSDHGSHLDNEIFVRVLRSFSAL